VSNGQSHPPDSALGLVAFLDNLRLSGPGQARSRPENVNPVKGGVMAQGKERTKEQLYRQAKKLGVKGRSKMNKGQLKAAVDRRA
jgi:hypothetical protein